MTMPGDWAPDDCTLPTAERPLRVAEFDEFFTVVLRFDRPQPTRLDLVLPRDAEATDRYLADRKANAARSSRSASNRTAEDVVMHIGVPSARVKILDAIEARIAR